MLNYNFEVLATEAEKAGKNPKIKYKPPVNTSFLEHSLPVLASIPLVYRDGLVSASETWKKLSTDISTPNGKISADNMKNLLKFLYWTKRANLISRSQIREPRLASLTPIPMYAHKLYNDVPYEKWDKKDEGMPIFLGRQLRCLVEIEEVPTLTLDEVIELRKEALIYKSGVRVGTIEKLYNYKMNINHINGIKYDKTILFMLLQLWLANASIRNVESMILDPINWSNIPEPYDQKKMLPEKNAKVKIDEIKDKIKDEFPW